jgi:hypothetical protein
MYLLFLFTIPLLGVIGNVFFSRLIVKGGLLLLHSSFCTCIFLSDGAQYV